METHYEDFYNRREYYWGSDIPEIALDVLKIMPPTKTIRILDIGCGEGQTAVFFARNGYIVSAFDVTESGVEKGKKLAESAGVEVDFFRADLLQYEFKRDFDIIYSSGSLQYIPPARRKEILDSIKDHTTLGGLNVLTAFVEKSFIEVAPDWESHEYFWQAAEIFSHYSKNWKFEVMSETIFDCNSARIPHQHCMDSMIARKVVE